MTAPPAGDAPPRQPRVSDHLANERTFLAWIRTSIALISLGFVVAKFSVWLRQFQATVLAQRSVGPAGRAPAALLPRVGVSLPAGIALMAAGAGLAVFALVRQRDVDRAIERGDFRLDHTLAALVTGAVVVAAVAFIAYLAATNVAG